MLFYLLILFNLFLESKCDIVMVNDYYEDDDKTVSSDNLIALALWGLSVCKCVEKVCQCKNKLPINLELSEDKKYITLENKNKDKKNLKKLKKDLNEVKKIIINYEKELNS